MRLPRGWLVLGALAASGCAKCGASAVVDAGVAAPVKVGPTSRSNDLRTVALLTFPEYRGTEVKVGVARMRRVLSGTADWPAVMRATFAKNRATEVPFDGGVDGGIAGSLDAFSLQLVELGGGRAEASISLPIDGDTLGRLYTNPTSLSSAQLGLYLPNQGVTIDSEVFDFHLEYDAMNVRRATFLTRQMIELLLGNSQWVMRGAAPDGWQPNPPDGGYGEVPDAFTVTLVGVVDGATVRIQRDGPHVTIDYTLVTLER